MIKLNMRPEQTRAGEENQSSEGDD